ncbi:hypothetical protein QGP82_21480 [Leptothoe sp. LEGE 181152]|nr:hypothetical protein [Leptothoe sp. LEGE 181152]
MKGDRITVALHFVVLVAFVPFTFLLMKGVVDAFFSSFSVDDTVCQWIDNLFRLPTDLDPRDANNVLERALAGGTHRWLIDICTLLPTLWHLRFLTGAVEELRRIYGGINPLNIVEVLGRWVALAALIQVAVPIVAVVFFHSIRFVVWEPLAFLVAWALLAFLFFWGWQYPNRRLKHVLKIYHFERLKSEG